MQAPASVIRMVSAPVQGSVTQQKIEATVTQLRDQATFSEVNTSLVQVKEVGETQYVTGPTTEVEQPAMHINVDQEQKVAGQLIQQTVEIPTVQVIEQIMEIPEVVTREVIQECPQIMQQTV